MKSNEPMKATINHYDVLIEEGADFTKDPAPLQEYMDKWDGQAFIDALKLTGKENVLEIGVGTGRLGLKVCGNCGSYIGIDISSKTIEQAKENLTKYKNVELICTDFMKYECTEQFDVVYSSLTFMHIEDKLNAIRKVAVMLKTGGRFVLSIDNNPSKVIDYGTRCIDIYPDNSDDICRFIKAAKLELIREFETEFSTIFIAEKQSDQMVQRKGNRI